MSRNDGYYDPQDALNPENVRLAAQQSAKKHVQSGYEVPGATLRAAGVEDPTGQEIAVGEDNYLVPGGAQGAAPDAQTDLHQARVDAMTKCFSGPDPQNDKKLKDIILDGIINGGKNGGINNLYSAFDAAQGENKLNPNDFGVMVQEAVKNHMVMGKEKYGDNIQPASAAAQNAQSDANRSGRLGNMLEGRGARGARDDSGAIGREGVSGLHTEEESPYVTVANAPVDEAALAAAKDASRIRREDSTLSEDQIARQVAAEAAKRGAESNYAATSPAGFDEFGKEQTAADIAAAQAEQMAARKAQMATMGRANRGEQATSRVGEAAAVTPLKQASTGSRRKDLLKSGPPKEAPPARTGRGARPGDAAAKLPSEDGPSAKRSEGWRRHLDRSGSGRGGSAVERLASGGNGASQGGGGMQQG